MDNTIIVALIGLAGSGLGAFGGVMASARLTQYRLQMLEEKVNKHNNLIERMYECEKNIDIHTAHLDTIDHRLDELEKGA